MRLLVVGANGLLGSNVVYAGISRDWTVLGTYHSTNPDFDIPLVQFDLAAADHFPDLIARLGPDVVVNCAAMTDVDACEADPETAHVCNGMAPGDIAAACAEHGVEFVHVSTDYVFDGRTTTPYSETAEPNPIQVYGKSKLAGERTVLDRTDSALVTRLAFVWGIHRSSGELIGFPSWVASELQNGQEVPLFTDQRVTPTRAGQAAETILDLIETPASGRLHIACRSCVTPYEFGSRIADRIDADGSLLTRSSMEDLTRVAPRPADTCLAVDRLEDVLGRAQPSIEADLDAVWTTC